jgi:hypothetical protein
VTSHHKKKSLEKGRGIYWMRSTLYNAVFLARVVIFLDKITTTLLPFSSEHPAPMIESDSDLQVG